jgi:predicted transcriptional regulator
LSEESDMSGKNKRGSDPSHMCYLLGINPSQWKLLNTMLNKKEKAIISCKELQEELGLDSSYVSRILSRLMNKGLVSRKYMFVNNSPPLYCYTPLSKEGLQEKVNAKMVSISVELESVGLCVSGASEVNDGITEKDD